MKRLLFILSILIFGIVGCKNKQNEQNKIFNYIQIENILDTDSASKIEINPIVQDKRKTMYVNLSSGLIGYAEPSESSTVIKTLLHGQRIVINEITNQPDTIDEITNYWYRTYYWNESNWAFGDTFWLFGAYLSEDLPFDAHIFLGKWHYRDQFISEYDCEFITHYNFYAAGGYRKDSHMNIVNIGKWNLDGNSLTIQSHDLNLEEGKWNEEYEILNAQIIILDRSNINLIWHDEKISELVRCNISWIKN